MCFRPPRHDVWLGALGLAACPDFGGGGACGETAEDAMQAGGGDGTAVIAGVDWGSLAVWVSAVVGFVSSLVALLIAFGALEAARHFGRLTREQG